MLVEQVAGSQWNGWPDAHGIRGRITVVRAPAAIDIAASPGGLTNCTSFDPFLSTRLASPLTRFERNALRSSADFRTTRLDGTDLIQSAAIGRISRRSRPGA